MERIFLYTALCACFLNNVASGKIIEGNIKTRNDYKSDYSRIDPTSIHDVIFCVKQLNMDVLEAKLYDVSNPSSINYRNHMTAKQVADVSGNPAGINAVLKYLKNNDVDVLRHSLYSEFITARAPIGKWEKILSTKFYVFYHVTNEHYPVVRALQYTLPTELVDFVNVIFHLVHLPLPNRGTGIIKKDATNGQIKGMTPELLNSHYGIFSNEGNPEMSQTIYSSAGQYYSSEDIAMFQERFNIDPHPVDFDPMERDSPYQCYVQPDSCMESNLDLEYIMAISRNTYTTIVYDYENDFMVTWITDTAKEGNPSPVQSMSYGYQDSDLRGAEVYAEMFNIQAVKLGLMGVTILVASGDDGAPGAYARNNQSACGYDASFPASSPFVVAVGATMGPEVGLRERACQSNLGGVITSGGGFSSVYEAPPFQQAAINSYFETVKYQPMAGYNRNGRGLPDIAIAGNGYPVIIGGKWYLLSGTSASTPTFAGMVSLVNAELVRRNLPTIGFLTPAIYFYNGQFTRDIVLGSNFCPSSKNCPTECGCCPEGYYSSPGWDPVTGFGAIDFWKFYMTFIPVN